MRPRILSTHAYSLSPAWLERVDAIDRRGLSTARLFTRVVRSARKYEAVVLDGSGGWRTRYIDLLAAAVIARIPRGPVVVITDCSWKMGQGLLDRAICRVGITLLDSRNIRYCVRSTDELALLPAIWGVDASRVLLTPYGHTLTDEELAEPPKHDRGVFSGGNALRDFPTLLEAVRGLQTEVTIATSLCVGETGQLPPNVKVVPTHPHSRFIELMRDAEVVVVPFRAGIRRASGLDTYLSAMGLGNVVIVSECPGVRDYIQHGVTGLIVPPAEPTALRSALEWALDPANADHVASIRKRARQVAAERFTFARHAKVLLQVVDDAVSADASQRHAAEFN